MGPWMRLLHNSTNRYPSLYGWKMCVHVEIINGCRHGDLNESIEPNSKHASVSGMCGLSIVSAPARLCRQVPMLWLVIRCDFSWWATRATLERWFIVFSDNGWHQYNINIDETELARFHADARTKNGTASHCPNFKRFVICSSHQCHNSDRLLQPLW